MEGVASNEVVVCEDDQTDGSTSQPVYVQLSDGEAFIQEPPGESCGQGEVGSGDPIIHYVQVVPEAMEGTEVQGEPQQIQIIQHGNQLTAIGEHHDLGLLQQAMLFLQQQGGNEATAAPELGTIEAQYVTQDTDGDSQTIYIVQPEQTASSSSGTEEATVVTDIQAVDALNDATPLKTSINMVTEETNNKIICESNMTSDVTLATSEENGNCVAENNALDVKSPALKNDLPVLDVQCAPESIDTREELQEAKADPIVVVPLKRGRGRPRKQTIPQPPAPPPRSPSPPPAEEEGVELTSRGRPKRKAALKFLASWEALKKKSQEDGLDISPPPSSHRRQPARPVSHVTSPSKADKENRAPPVKLSSSQPVTINITVKEKKALQVIEDIGIHMLYYCRRCTFYSKQLMVITDHILQCRTKDLTEIEQKTASDAGLTAAILENASLKGIARRKILGGSKPVQDSDVIHIDEHNYAAEVQLAPESEEEEAHEECNEDYDKEEDDNVPLAHLQPRKWFCSECQYTVFYSETDLTIHQQCHGKSGTLPLHCFVCKENSVTDRPPPKHKLEWHRLKVHLSKFHKVNFQLACEKCEEVLSCHSAYHRHAGIHRHRCSKPSCQYETDNKCDLEIHEKCHMSEESCKLACYLCGYQCPQQPYKWSVLHSHLVTQHPGVIDPPYSCNICKKDFYKMRLFIDHKILCSKNLLRTCDNCGQDVNRYELARHLRTCDREAPEVIEESVAEGQPVGTVQISKGETQNEGQPVSTVQISKGETQKEATEAKDAASPDGKSIEQPKPAAENGADSEGKQEKIPGISGSFRCPQHGQRFENQADLTKHYIEDHWGITDAKVHEAQMQKEQKQQNIQQRVAKRRRGRPRKVVNIDSEEGSQGDFEWSRAKRKRKHPWLPQLRGMPKTERCQHCYKKFPSSEHLARHIIRAHTEEKLKRMLCQACGKDFRNRAQWRNHYRTVHEGKKRRKVYYPPKKPTQKKMYVCELCGYTTPEGVRLRNHRMSVHEGQMPYQCDMCDYKTNEKADMRRHRHKHEGIKRYSCHACAYRTDQRWLLVNHCLRQHGIRMNRISRDTRGGFWSNRRRRRDNPTDETSLAMVPQTITHEVFLESGELVGSQEGYYVPMVTTNENGEEQVAMYAIGGDTITEHEVDVHTVEEEAKTGEVVYIQEDGTIMEAEEAALMLLAVAPVEVEANYSENIQQ